ncbi:GNAT family N-acetyltransferase [Kiloniella laminariae]|uniref:GNAT family N-acetyltransferase n=1 Tax=Kiloniella laminariae TaxID=454162 RepID=UPI00036C8920|nr:GNAT family N-acetyltransferase [Kiloniella laminariae]
MDMIKFVRLSEIKEEQIIALMNNELVGRQMPLLAGGFSGESCRAFLKAKEQLWHAHGYGPWAFLIGGEFAGWGGLQPEQGDADFALVLHPRFWGWGRQIFNKVRDQAFNEMGLESITILLPPGRPNSKAVTRLGFVEDGQQSVDGELFMRFRLRGSHK